MALYGPDNWGAFRKKKPFSLMGGYLGDRAGPGQNPFPGLTDPNWSGVPRAYSTPFYEYEAEHSTSPVVAARKGGKKSNKLKYIVEALQEMEGETPEPLAGRDRVGGTRPGMPGYTPTNMGAYVGDPVAMQAAIAEARRKKEKESLMNLLGGGAY